MANTFLVMFNKALLLHPKDFNNFYAYKNVQSQLQEMLKTTFPDGAWKPFDVFKNFWYWFLAYDSWGEGEPEPYFSIPIKANSMEELWLLFLMKEMYNETWNGNDWQAIGGA